MVWNEKTKNPFVIEGYVSPDFFCDREKETSLLTRHLTNGCNVTLMAPRRLGKSGLVFNLKSATIIQYTIKGRFMSR